MTAQNNGGPAFPVDLSYEKDGFHYRLTSDGMTLRDYFAAKAMQACFSDPNVSFWPDALEMGAQAAYRMADAMLKAREQ